VGLLGPLGISLMEDLACASTEFCKVSGGDNGSGVAIFVVFVESTSGGASSESEES